MYFFSLSFCLLSFIYIILFPFTHALSLFHSSIISSPLLPCHFLTALSKTLPLLLLKQQQQLTTAAVAASAGWCALVLQLSPPPPTKQPELLLLQPLQ